MPKNALIIKSTIFETRVVPVTLLCMLQIVKNKGNSHCLATLANYMLQLLQLLYSSCRLKHSTPDSWKLIEVRLKVVVSRTDCQS